MSGDDRVAIADLGKSCEFRLDVRAIEISDDGVWSVAIRNGLGTLEDQCRLMLKGDSFKNQKSSVHIKWQPMSGSSAVVHLAGCRVRNVLS